MKITLNQLKQKFACYYQLEAFKKRFGKSVVITKAKCLKYADVFDWGWAADNFLNDKGYAAYCAIIFKDGYTFDERTNALAFWEGVKAQEAKKKKQKKVQPKRKSK